MNQQDDTGGASGTTSFLWLGGGVRLPVGALRFFAEAGFVGGMDEDKGFSDSAGGSLGVLLVR